MQRGLECPGAGFGGGGRFVDKQWLGGLTTPNPTGPSCDLFLTCLSSVQISMIVLWISPISLPSSLSASLPAQCSAVLGEARFDRLPPTFYRGQTVRIAKPPRRNRSTQLGRPAGSTHVDSWGGGSFINAGMDAGGVSGGLFGIVLDERSHDIGDSIRCEAIGKRRGTVRTIPPST